MAIVLNLALTALRRNRLRTGLTMLSLIVGVAAVIAVVALGTGARSVIARQVASAGTNLIIVSAGNWTASGVRLGMGSSSRLTAADAEAIQTVPGVAAVSPRVRTQQQLINGRRNWSAPVEGVGADLPRIRHWPLSTGMFFSSDDVRRAARVCVLGAVAQERLFERGEAAVGRQIRIGAQIFRVVGVMAGKGQSSGGQDQDDAVFVPFTTAQKKLMGVRSLRSIYVSAVSSDRAGAVAGDIRHLLRVRHELSPLAADDFRVRTLDDIVAVRTRAIRTMTTLLSAIAAVSLLVGGIGVMNIMLVAVTERTREIGLRLAVGARQRDVRRQFLTEAVLISATGGLLGVGAGSLLAPSLTYVLGWPTDLALDTAIATFAFATATGTFFGWYPAGRAAAVEPIDALRYE